MNNHSQYNISITEPTCKKMRIILCLNFIQVPAKNISTAIKKIALELIGAAQPFRTVIPLTS